MKGIYTRSFTVQDDKLNDAMEICKGLAEVRKVHFPDHQSYFSFQIGGNPRSFRETLILSLIHISEPTRPIEIA